MIVALDYDKAYGYVSEMVKSAKKSDSSKVSIHTYGSKVYIKGDNKKLFDELYSFVKKKFD